MIRCESLKNLQKKSIMEHNLAWQLKYKLANWGSFDALKLQTNSVQTTNLLYIGFTADLFQKQSVLNSIL